MNIDNLLESYPITVEEIQNLQEEMTDEEMEKYLEETYSLHIYLTLK